MQRKITDGGRLEQARRLMRRTEGATRHELLQTTGWQAITQVKFVLATGRSRPNATMAGV
jgi:hypothetical protein